MEVPGGMTAHPSNWYCPKCIDEAKGKTMSDFERDSKILMQAAREGSKSQEPTYRKFVESKFKTGRQILESWGIPRYAIPEEAVHKMSLLHAAIGISGEAGELLDAIKKFGMYNKPMDDEREENIQEELGDINFYTEALIKTVTDPGTKYDFSPWGIELANRKKLDKRYKNGYSDKAAQERVDKQEVSEADTITQELEEHIVKKSPFSIVEAKPLNWIDVENFCQNKVIVVEVDHMHAHGMHSDSVPDNINYYIPDFDSIYYDSILFCMDADKLDSVVKSLYNPGEK